MCCGSREILPGLEALYLYVHIYTAAVKPFLDSVGVRCMIMMPFSCFLWDTIQGRPLICRPCAQNSQSCYFTFYQ